MSEQEEPQEIKEPLFDGTMLNLPEDLSTDFTIFLGYRGKW